MPFNGFFPGSALVPAPFGLLSVATVVQHSEDHFARGTFSTENQHAGIKGEIWSICGDAADSTFADSTADTQFPDGEAFGIRVERTCSTLGINTEERHKRLIDILDLATGKAVERELWAGGHAKTRTPDGFYLADPTTTLANGTAVGVRRGLALLESKFADESLGEQATIHMTVGVASLLGDTLIEKDGVLMTRGGSLVAVGAGYTGLNDAGNAGPFIHATGPITVHLGAPLLTEDRLADAVNPRTNEVKSRAERPAALVVEGGSHIAVQVDLTTI